MISSRQKLEIFAAGYLGVNIGGQKIKCVQNKKKC